jgi:hypothetical protein
MKRLNIQIAITVAATVIALIHVLWPSIKIDGVTVTLVLAAIVPWLSPLIRSFKAGGIEIEFQELQSDVRSIQVALTGIVTKHEIKHLRRLAEKSPYQVQYGEPLWRELEELDAKGFIKPTDDIGRGRLNTIKARFGHESLDPNRPVFDLNDYVKITQSGEEYVQLYNSVIRNA